MCTPLQHLRATVSTSVQQVLLVWDGHITLRHNFVRSTTSCHCNHFCNLEQAPPLLADQNIVEDNVTQNKPDLT
jgi:hypothetical protein